MRYKCPTEHENNEARARKVDFRKVPLKKLSNILINSPLYNL
ncbi:MAG: hypothetical protein RL497_3063 [Pseudomonadota bacterium]|jgi:hypothetical protein